MTNYKPGDRVIHDNGKQKFGAGTVKSQTRETVTVRWDKHRTPSGNNTCAVNHSSVKPL